MCQGNLHILATKCYNCVNYEYHNYNTCHNTRIHASDVKELREYTGADMDVCKNALKLAYNDFNKAIDIVRECGYAVKVNCKNFIMI